MSYTTKKKLKNEWGTEEKDLYQYLKTYVGEIGNPQELPEFHLNMGWTLYHLSEKFKTLYVLALGSYVLSPTDASQFPALVLYDRPLEGGNSY